jgi:hypothetical protein
MKSKEAQMGDKGGCYSGSVELQKSKRRDAAYKRTSIVAVKKTSTKLKKPSILKPLPDYSPEKIENLVY